jgi:hypothetical protein
VITLIAGMITIYSVYIVWRGFAEPTWGTIPSGVFGLVTAAGLVRGRRWAEPLTYAFLWLAAGSWIGLAAAAVVAATRPISVLEYLPGALLLLLCAGSCLVVLRHFHPRDR